MKLYDLNMSNILSLKFKILHYCGGSYVLSLGRIINYFLSLAVCILISGIMEARPQIAGLDPAQIL